MKPNIEMEYTHNDITYKLKDESLNKYYDFVIYTDGSCTKNPGGKGGCGYVVCGKRTFRGYCVGYRKSTNNRMEILAAIHALETIQPGKRIMLISDSEYLVKTVNNELKINKNQDLWDRLFALIDKTNYIDCVWIKGHKGMVGNEIANYLATEGTKKSLIPDAVYEKTNKYISPKKAKKKNSIKKKKKIKKSRVA